MDCRPTSIRVKSMAIEPQVFTDKSHLVRIVRLHYSEDKRARSREIKKGESINDQCKTF